LIDWYVDKGLWLEGIASRPGWDAKVAFYDTAADKAIKVKRDTGVEAVVPDLIHELRNVLAKANNFNKYYAMLTASRMSSRSPTPTTQTPSTASCSAARGW